MSSKLLSYPVYKESGVPWINQVPEHWKMERAMWLFQKMNRPVKDSDDVITCFRDGVVTLRKNRRVRGFTESLKEIGYQGILKGDLVIHAMDAFAGAVGVSDSNGKGTPVYSVCEPKPGVNPYYYAFIIREMARSHWILANAKGIRERSTDFRFKDFSSQYVPLPPLYEQKAIVRFLDHTDHLIRRYIRAKQKQINLLEEQKQAIIDLAVTRGLNRKAHLRFSGNVWLGEVPDNWVVLPLKRWVSTKITDGPHETPELLESGIPFMSAESMVDGHFDFFHKRGYISQEVHDIYSKKCHPIIDDIFMCKSGATTGKVAIVETNQEFSIWSPLALIRVNQEKVLPHLLFLILQSKYVQKQVQTTWSYGTQPNLSMAAMERLIVALPPREQQPIILASIKSWTDPINYSITRIRNEIVLMQEFRTRLISDVITGRLDVREASGQLPQELEELEPIEKDELSMDEEEQVEMEPADLEDA